MSSKKIGLTIFSLTILFLALTAVMTLVFSGSAKEIVENAKITTQTLKINGEIASGTLTTKSAHDSSSYYKNGSFYYEAKASNLNKVFIPSISEVQLYCLQKGNPIIYNKEAVDTIRALSGKTGTSTSGSHKARLPAKRYSNTYYTCVNDHTDLVASGAYIVTAPSNFIAPTDGTYTAGVNLVSYFAKGENISEEVKQIAIWLNPDLKLGENFYDSGSTFTYIEMSEQLNDEAIDYKEYENGIKEKNDKLIYETSDKKVQINANQIEQSYIIGPFKMEYHEGNSGSANFSGISNMVVKGYNDKEGKKLIKDIEIVKFIQNGETQELNFFDPKKELGYVDREENCYPESGVDFYVQIKNPNKDNLESDEVVRYVDIEVEYSYMTATATSCRLQGHQLVATPVQTAHDHSYDDDGDFRRCYVNYKWVVSESHNPQQFMMDAWGERNLYKIKINLNGENDGDGGNEPPSIPLDITMNLGGYVWEDVPGDKTTTVDGLNSNILGSEEIDRILPNVKVTLYECPINDKGQLQSKNGKIVGYVADLLANADLDQLSEQEKLNRVNPQITDENGYYQFDGLNSLNKYYVVFEYNGQIYEPTEYLVTDRNEDGELIHEESVYDIVVNAKLYNTEIWEATSKGAEFDDERNEYNENFKEIGSSPVNYPIATEEPLNKSQLEKIDGKYYNESFSMYDLMGYTLNEDGKYEQTEVQLIDSFYDLQDGNIIETNMANEGEISKRIKTFIKNNKKYPDNDELIQIYEDIVNDYADSKKEETALWRKLQFIEDCKINAYTASAFNDGEIDLYPVYDNFTIDSEKMVIPGEGTVPPIYDGQYYVNLGLWRRQEANLALRKDVYRAATRINGKTEIYEYDKRSEEDKYWEIQVRMQDYTNYYGTSYNREIYPADYNYRASITNLFGSELELYITYKITLRNTSQNILSEITEVVDYYDKDYTYKPELSWVMYKDNNSDGNEKVYVSKDEYYDMMHNLDGNKIKEARDIDSSYSTKQTDGTYNGESIYTEVSQADIEEKLNSVYIRGLEDKKLATGESAYIYLTFKVNADSEGPVILDDDNSLKENFVEINGYTTYYAKGQKLPNDVEITNNDTVAGLFDADSTPGNLCLDDLKGDRYEKNFEDDTDRAKSIKVTLDEEAIRRINGIVWEDERTQKISDSIIGDGLRQSDEIGIKGVTVELVEVLENGNQYIWQTVNTGDNGKYQFENIIPGNYIVRFSYGHNKDIVLTTSNGGYNAVSYNGQDFKSTVYSQDLKNNVELADYIETHYSIQEADKLAQSGLNLSDAKDLWETKQIKIGRTDNNYTKYENESYQGRQNVNSYSLEKVQNHIAEVLASPYLNPNEQLIEELIKNTNMVAESGIIVLEGEYNRTNTDGLNDNSNGSDIYLFENDKNGNYTINNVDLGLTERPKAQLELNSKVTNVKITLSNKEVLFDAQKTAQNLVWLSNKEYNLTDKMSNNKYKEYYDNSKTNNKYNRYAYKTEIDELITGLYQNGANGIVQATMDEELMHGATIDVIYELKVTNSGETDYTGKEFYYKARGANESNKVVTSANLVTDYVANNLQYKEVENKGWNLIKSEELINKGLVNNSLNDKVNKFNSILQTSELEKYLKPGEEITKTLSLSQTITAQNENDDLTYVNMAEIVQTSNNVGRRMAYSIVGNQDPTLDAPSEVDATKAEEVLILPPFGSEYIYYGLAIAVAAILGLGIFLIKKKVMR